MIKDFGKYILASRKNAFMLVLLFSVVPFFQWLSGVILVLVTLRKGPKEGLLLIAPASLIYVLLAVDDLTTVIWVSLLAGIVYLWLVGCILWRFASWQKVLEYSLCLAVLCVVLVHSVVPDLEQWLMTQFHEVLSRFGANLQQGAAELGEEQSQMWQSLITSADNTEVLQRVARVMLGTLLMLNIATKLILVMFARWWQAKLYNPAGLRVELQTIRLHYLVTPAFFLCLLAGYSDIIVFLDVVPIFQGVLCLAGLSLLHFVANCCQARWKSQLLLVLVYALIVSFFKIAVWTIAVIAIADSVFNLRHVCFRHKASESER
jgi:hypothetical protein